MMKKACVLTALCVLLFTPEVFCQSAERLFSQAKAAQSAGNKDVAFLLYRQILREYPDSAYAEESQFLMGQYYFDSRNYFNAAQTFGDFVRKFPQSRFAKDANQYLARIRLGSLKERADKLFEEGKLAAASVLYEQYLAIDPDNAEVKDLVEQIRKTQQEVHFGFEQLNRERKKFEHEREALTRQVTDLEEQRKQVILLQKQALELNKVTTENYEKKLSAAVAEMEKLHTRIAGLEKELEGWRHRAVLEEAASLSQPLPRTLTSLAEPGRLPRIIFEGGKADPDPEEGEVQVSDIVRDGFPVVVITEAKLDAKKNLLHVEAVVSVDLASPWPEGTKMKFRVDFTPKAGQPAPDPQFLVRYFDVSEMDEMEETTNSYRKRVVFTAEERKIERYEAAAFLVKSK